MTRIIDDWYFAADAALERAVNSPCNLTREHVDDDSPYDDADRDEYSAENYSDLWCDSTLARKARHDEHGAVYDRHDGRYRVALHGKLQSIKFPGDQFGLMLAQRYFNEYVAEHK